MTEINELSLLTLTNCPHCHTAKILLDKYKIKYREINFDNEENKEIFQKLKINHVPYLLVPKTDGYDLIDGDININNWVKKHIG